MFGDIPFFWAWLASMITFEIGLFIGRRKAKADMAALMLLTSPNREGFRPDLSREDLHDPNRM